MSAVRLAYPHELDTLPPIKAATRDAAYPIRSRPLSLDALAILQADGMVWVATDETDQPVGVATATMMDGTLFLSDLHVHPDHQFRGHGRALLHAVIDHARWIYAPAVTLLTDKLKSWNAPFYARHGFVILRADELPPDLAAKWAADLARGHDPARLCAMMKRL
jgi:GNAT superfamily N-acetyltransferase